jgi:hypothetical protein
MEELYRTTDGDLVAYLNGQGFKLESIQPESQARSIVFSLKQSPHLKKEIEAYYNDSATVTARAYAEQIRKIRVIISTTKRNFPGEGVD